MSGGESQLPTTPFRLPATGHGVRVVIPGSRVPCTIYSRRRLTDSAGLGLFRGER
jgi:hypothetical protein